jgi:hypothetical protein
VNRPSAAAHFICRTRRSGGKRPLAAGAALLLAAGFLVAAPSLVRAGDPAGVTDSDVERAIQRGREYLIGPQNPDGSFTEKRAAGRRGPSLGRAYVNGESVLAFMTLAYMGEHPNRKVMQRAIPYAADLDIDRDFADLAGYAVPIRIMGFCYVHDKLSDRKKKLVRAAIGRDLAALIKFQRTSGGWRYELSHGADYDFSITQWVVLAFREANLVGFEVPKRTLQRAMALYRRKQHPDGGWGYDDELRPDPYLSMTAAGLASMYILSEQLEPAAGCPCARGSSRDPVTDTNRRIDAALEWIIAAYRRRERQPEEFDEDKDQPGFGGVIDRGAWHLYEMYCVERVGIAAGYKYFGGRDWYRRGAEYLVRKQEDDGSWGSISDTCFALLFLCKGRSPVLFNKVRFAGLWNQHRRDVANLTGYIEQAKEQRFHWQIVDLEAPLEELHDAPILYISAETPPKWDEITRQKLRAFTDQGGTVLFEASCGNRKVRDWFEKTAAALWPEWPLADLPEGHGVWEAAYPLAEDRRPQIRGVHDGLRTLVFFSPDDISCPWHMQAVTRKEYLFKWGINLYTYATDGAPLRAKLARRDRETPQRYDGPLRAGAGAETSRLARVRYGGDWQVGRNYRPFRTLAEHLKEEAGLALEVAGGGVRPKDLKGQDVAFLAGTEAFELDAEEREALKNALEAGTFLWLEAAMGSPGFDEAVRRLAEALEWNLRRLPADHPLMTGEIPGGLGRDLTEDVQFRRTLRIARADRDYAELIGIFAGGELVGVYSPLDVAFSLTGYQAYGCGGYEAEDALAVASNIVLWTRRGEAGTPPYDPAYENLPWKRRPAIEPEAP